MKQGIPVVAIGGSITLDRELAHEAGFAEVYAVTPEGMPLSEAMKGEVAWGNVYNTVKEILS
jgi:glycerate kinase